MYSIFDFETTLCILRLLEKQGTSLRKTTGLNPPAIFKKYEIDFA